jgi:hypothetical protein
MSISIRPCTIPFADEGAHFIYGISHACVISSFDGLCPVYSLESRIGYLFLRQELASTLE